jgi:hypothetical protein
MRFHRPISAAICGSLLLVTTEATTEGFLLVGTHDGANNWDGMGMQVCFITSINGDATPEIATGAFCTDGGGGVNSGSLLVYDGAVPHALLWNFCGPSPGDQLGRSAANCGDLNGDGIDDLIVGAPMRDNVYDADGSAFVLSGIDGSLIFELQGVNQRATFGWAVAGAGDLNQDGVPDLLVGAPGDAGKGSITIVSGSDGAQLAKYWSPNAGSQLGYAVATAGDLTGDGIPEILVSDPRADEQHGSVRILDGEKVGLGFRKLINVRLAILFGPNAGSRFGEVVSCVGDLDLDGVPETAIGAPGDDSMYIYSGVSHSLHTVFSGHGAVGKTKDGIGHTAAVNVGDINGDSVEDLLIGAPYYHETGLAAVGAAGLFSGADERLLSLRQCYYDQNDYFGAAVYGNGVDFDGDGWPDWVIGIPGYGDKSEFSAYGAIIVETSR